MSMMQTQHQWGIILAGGDGKRLLSFTRALNGDDRPKQFSAVIGSETLLQQTCHRVGRIARAEQTLVVVTEHHERFYSNQVAPPQQLLVQPYNHGTSQAILLSLLRIHAKDPDGVVAFFPSDHHFANGAALTAQMNEAFTIARASPESVVLLGIEPLSAETSYGWIEPGETFGEAFRVRRFWEKPTQETAQRLMTRGCLWNSFIMTGRVGAFLGLFRKAKPALLEVFAARLVDLGSTGAVRDLYDSTEPSNFSDDVLSRCPRNLAVLPGRNLGWSDLGEPARVMTILRQQPDFVPAQTA